jgi:hypothetical protein
MGLFSDSKKTQTTITQTPIAQDQRTQVEGDVGTFIGPGATVATPGGGAVSAAPYAQVRQQITTTGMSPGEVQGLLDSIFEESAKDRSMVGELAGSLSSGIREQSLSLSDIVAATKAPEQSMLTALIPVGLLLLFFWWSK